MKPKKRVPKKKNIKKKVEENNQNLIHVKVGYDESINSKKRILSTEMELLKIKKNIKINRLLKEEELNLKLKLRELLRETNSEIKKMIQYILPNVKDLEKLRKKSEKQEKIPTQKIEIESQGDLDYQLEEIKKKLAAIGQ